MLSPNFVEECSRYGSWKDEPAEPESTLNNLGHIWKLHEVKLRQTTLWKVSARKAGLVMKQVLTTKPWEIKGQESLPLVHGLVCKNVGFEQMLPLHPSPWAAWMVFISRDSSHF